jgi:NADH dehydrogenase
MEPNILILGGSGFIGRSLCEQLARAGDGSVRITVATRRRQHAQPMQGLPGLSVIEADVHDTAQLQALLVGQDIVINLIAILQGSPADFERVHVQLPRRLLAACGATAVRRLIHVSALGAASDAPSHYLRSKAAGEAALRDAERTAGLALTILRPSVVFGARDNFLNLFAKLQILVPLLPLAGASARFQPVWVEDVAAAIRRCVLDPGTVGQTFELAGPQQLSLAEIVRLAGEISGHRRLIVPLPGPLAWAQARLMELLPGEPLMSRDNLDSMRVPSIATGNFPGLAELGIAPQAIGAVVPAYLAPGQRSGL